MKSHSENFYLNWLGKADSYNEDSLANHFDKFISLYVIFNVLYMKVAGVNHSKNFQDKTAATDYVIQFLKGSYFIDHLLNDDESSHSLDNICKIIDEEQFHIIIQWGESKRDLDEKLLISLYSKNKQEKAKAILSLFYHIRCNLFHGHKGFEERQKQLLIPVNHLLRKTVVLTFNKLSERNLMQ